MQRRPSTSVISNLIALHSDDCLVCSISVSIIYHLSYCCIYHLPICIYHLPRAQGYHLLFLESSFSLLSSLFFLFFTKKLPPSCRKVQHKDLSEEASNGHTTHNSQSTTLKFHLSLSQPSKMTRPVFIALILVIASVSTSAFVGHGSHQRSPTRRTSNLNLFGPKQALAIEKRKNPEALESTIQGLMLTKSLSRADAEKVSIKGQQWRYGIAKNREGCPYYLFLFTQHFLLATLWK